MFKDFEICVNTEFVFGRGAEQKLGQKLSEHRIGTVLIHHDGGDYLEGSGLLGRVRQSLDASGIKYVELGGVQPNPRLSLVRKGIELWKVKPFDGIVAIGGGSVIDSAKAIGLGVCVEHDVWDFFTGQKTPTKTIPVAAILTCPASGSESSQVTVINNQEEHKKLLVSAPIVRPAFAFMNPELSITLPAYPTACGIVDMFSHICERYFNNDDEFDVVDRMSEGVLRTLVNIGPKQLQELDNYEYRAQIMWISTIAQNNILGVGRDQDWATHSIANEITALYDVPHGATLSMIMGSWMRYVAEKKPKRFARYAQEVFGIRNELMDNLELAYQGIKATERFFESLGMPITLADLDVSKRDIQKMVDQISYEQPDRGIGNVVRLYQGDCQTIFEMALLAGSKIGENQ